MEVVAISVQVEITHSWTWSNAELPSCDNKLD